MDEIQEAIDNLECLPEIEPKEIRISVSDGMVDYRIGSAVSDTIDVTICDFDVQDMTPGEIAEKCCKIDDGSYCIFR